MRIVYLSRQFNRSGYAVLEALINSGASDIAAVVIPPLRPSQRTMSRLDRAATSWFERAAYRVTCLRQGARPLRFEGSLQRLAKRAGLKVDVIPSLKEPSGWERLARYEPDLLVLGGGWPELLPAEVFALAPLGAINTHPSLLPDYRGTDVHRWQILDGVRATGTTIHYIDHRFDTGAVIGQRVVEVSSTDTPQSLFQRTAEVAGPLMVDVLAAIAAAAPDRVEGHAQPDTQRPTLPKWPWGDDGFLRIDPSRTAAEVERLVRACAQESFVYGGPWFELAGRQFIVRHAELTSPEGPAPAGRIVTRRGVPLLHCSDGAVALLRLQAREPVPMQTASISGRRFALRHLSGDSAASLVGTDNPSHPPSKISGRLHSRSGSDDDSTSQ